MYRVMIVDDEKNVIASLKKSIPWASLGLEVAGEAESMTEALALFEKQPFHIVVSDIKMPGGSGLELFRELTALAPNTQGILISGHADFAYAQKALQCGIIGYCLKPVDTADLCTYLKKAVLRLERDTKPNQETLLTNAIAEENPDALIPVLKSYGLNPDAFYLAVTDGALPPNLLASEKARMRLQKGRLCLFLDEALTQEEADKLVDTYHLNGLGFLTNAVRAATLTSAIRTAVSLALHRFISGECRALCRCGAEDREVLSQLRNAISAQDNAQLEQLLQKMRDNLPDISIGCALRISNMIHNYRLDFSVEEDESGYAYDLSHLLSMYRNVEEMLDDLIRLLQEPEAPAESGFESENTNFLRLIRYIHQHYADDTLSLNSLAEVLHMTPSYVSRLFSRESGTTYRRYLTELRVEKAKELLATSGMSIAEVCDCVGFNDYFHFLRTFKRITGTSPGKYTGEEQV